MWHTRSEYWQSICNHIWSGQYTRVAYVDQLTTSVYVLGMLRRFTMPEEPKLGLISKIPIASLPLRCPVHCFIKAIEITGSVWSKSHLLFGIAALGERCRLV
jgi:hypothetical protein